MRFLVGGTNESQWVPALSEGSHMHHKRRRPKHQRAGCLLCKPHKDERLPKSIRFKGLKAPRRLYLQD
jgi:hypothetical protein